MATIITVKNNGSIRVEGLVEGDFELRDGSGNKFDLAGKNAISLCRCGASAKKPFCDGAHGKCGFESQVQAVQNS